MQIISRITCFDNPNNKAKSVMNVCHKNELQKFKLFLLTTRVLPACRSTIHFFLSHALATDSRAMQTCEKAGASQCYCEWLAPKSIVINALVPAYSLASDPGFQYKEPGSDICTGPGKREWLDGIRPVKTVLVRNQTKGHTLHCHQSLGTNLLVEKLLAKLGQLPIPSCY